MEMTPGRAPFTEDEDYTPLRKPKSATTTPTHQAAPAYNTGASGSNFFDPYNQQAIVNNSNDAMYGRTISPSKLSPYATEFVPRFSGNPSAVQQRLEQQQRHQQQYNQQNYQHYQQNNFSMPMNQFNNRHMPQQMASLTMSVQERLKIGNNVAGAAGNRNNTNNTYYQQQQQPPHHHLQHQPRNKHHHQPLQQQQQQRYQQRHHHNNSQNHGAAAHSGNNGSGSGSDVETIALDYLQTVIQCLNQNPGQFDSIATRFLTIFDGMENNQYVLSNAMEDIFQESIQNPNFRYMGAKLYNLLHMLDLKKDSLFHTLLKCKLDYHQQEVVQYMQTNQHHKVRETALFLAELYMQLRGDDTRIHLIAENIVYSLKQLLTKESVDNVRCICLTLKLAGYDLTADCATDMQEIIRELDIINVKSPGKYSLAANVISLQKNNWGRKVSSSNSLSDIEASSKSPEPLRNSDEPIFYGPDGRELTAEETDFLSGGAAELAAVGGGEEDDDVVDLDVDLDPEMDEETEKAYKEFCKLNSTK